MFTSYVFASTVAAGNSHAFSGYSSCSNRGLPLPKPKAIACYRRHCYRLQPSKQVRSAEKEQAGQMRAWLRSKKAWSRCPLAPPEHDTKRWVEGAELGERQQREEEEPS